MRLGARMGSLMIWLDTNPGRPQSRWSQWRSFMTSTGSSSFFSFQFWIWPSISLSIYIIDLVFRYLKRFFKRIKVVTMELPSRNVIFLTFKINTNVEFQPGQYILLQCENISALEWHPFTITDSIAGAGQTIFTLCVAVRGDWTGELYQKIFNLKLYSERSKRRRSRRRRRIPIPRKLIFVLDGPFPSAMESVLSKKRVVLIGAGIGVTPFISVFNYVMWDFPTLCHSPQKLFLFFPHIP